MKKYEKKLEKKVKQEVKVGFWKSLAKQSGPNIEKDFAIKLGDA